MRRITLVVIAALSTILAASALAAGNTSSKSVYHPTAAQVQGALGTARPTTTPDTATRPAPESSLPFTGSDLAFLAGASVILLATGYSLRRVTRKTPPG